MPRKPQVPTIQINGDTAPNHDDSVKRVRHNAKRKNIPSAGIEAVSPIWSSAGSTA